MTRPALVATYRLQLTADFTLTDALDVLDHVRDLGVSHLYLSPINTATAGSTHGYDWIPPIAVAPVLGGIDALRSLRRAAAERGLGIVVDIVPNHTGVEDPRQNAWWWDVLTHGAQSAYAHFFDIDWDGDNGADGKIALPVLGGPDDVDALEIDAEADELVFYEHRFPLAPGTPHDDARAAHDAQAYRLVPWDSGVIGYRRFFAVNGLAGLRQEDPDVYAATHELVRALVAEDLVDGIRVDHPDGLVDPVGYLQRLRSDIGDDRVLWVEKILATDEQLDPVLPVDGTTGYDALRWVDGVFVDPAAETTFTEVHQAITGDTGDAGWLHGAEHRRKRDTLHTLFPAERARLSRAIRAAARDAGDVDPTAVPRPELDDAIAEVIGRLGVYRADYPVLEGLLASTLDSVRDARPDLAGAVRLLAATVLTDGEPAVRLAQVCGATTAKSVEDSLFYRTARLVALQEVGGDPGRFGVTADEFHTRVAARASSHPRAMTTSSTHDTKRGEDVRARIIALTAHPDRWRDLVETMRSQTPPPDGVTGLFLLQNIIGVWPTTGAVGDGLRTRLHDYATKAIREAGLITGWTDVDEAAETAVHRWIDDVVDGRVGAEIARLVGDLAAEIEWVVLAHKGLSLLVPGVPDVYQGTEWFEDSLVDPDNRRPIEWDASTDHPKVRLVRSALAARRDHASAFTSAGGYGPLVADGADADRVVAFTVGADAAEVVVVVATRPGLRASLDVEGTWRDHETGEIVSGTLDVGATPITVLERHTKE
ncbi:malto-oligosyltrehalose synthase [Williamsia deligens]|uniref:Malto-oligosyltrehalose synthase n=1 Tax=Williamsia deligens TaxID=321325 RepID=A0ABW3G8Y4_9NOCA|nr:malto-oligosyltrehalose synthase [Williamsia deligens]MCP2195904.1 (1->4)-alpha-D-glucan 1-alpha-D-glucosylmutase [Williamsia deligens]